MRIYIIKKPGTNEVYIGQTISSLKLRLQHHFAKQKQGVSSHTDIYQWLDKTCTIELLEEFNSNEKDIVKEMNYIQEYITNGFTIKNTMIGQKVLNSNYDKDNGNKQRAKRHPNYHNWQSKISKKAKKENLTSKEYKLKYNIPDYDGQKFI